MLGRSLVDNSSQTQQLSENWSMCVLGAFEEGSVELVPTDCLSAFPSRRGCSNEKVSQTSYVGFLMV